MARDFCNRRTFAAELCTRLERERARDPDAGVVRGTERAMPWATAGARHTRGGEVAEAFVDRAPCVRYSLREPGRGLCFCTPSLGVGMETIAHGHDGGRTASQPQHAGSIGGSRWPLPVLERALSVELHERA